MMSCDDFQKSYSASTYFIVAGTYAEGLLQRCTFSGHTMP